MQEAIHDLTDRTARLIGLLQRTMLPRLMMIPTERFSSVALATLTPQLPSTLPTLASTSENVSHAYGLQTGGYKGMTAVNIPGKTPYAVMREWRRQSEMLLQV